jgi:hypothetical protein
LVPEANSSTFPFLIFAVTRTDEIHMDANRLTDELLTQELDRNARDFLVDGTRSLRKIIDITSLASAAQYDCLMSAGFDLNPQRNVKEVKHGLNCI